MGGSERRRGRTRTEDEERVGEGAEDGEEESADEPRPHDLEQQLAARGQVRGGLEHEEAVGQDEEEVPERGAGARQEPVRHLAPAAAASLLPLPRRRRGLRREPQRGGRAPREEEAEPPAAGDGAALRERGRGEEEEEEERRGRVTRRHGRGR